MKALKYGLTLMLGLSMLGFSERVQAQAADAIVSSDESTPRVDPEADQRGLQTPKYIENMVANQDFSTAVVEFEKYMKTAKGDPCDMIYLPLTFYYELLSVDTANTASHKDKMDSYFKKYMQTCGNTMEAYMLKDRMTEPKNYDSTVVWMTKAIELAPDYAILYQNRGYALWELQRTKEACADYKKAKELDEFYGDYYDDNCAKLEAAE